MLTDKQQHLELNPGELSCLFLFFISKGDSERRNTQGFPPADCCCHAHPQQ